MGFAKGVERRRGLLEAADEADDEENYLNSSVGYLAEFLDSFKY